MKKLFNGRFLFILASSLISLIVLVVLAFYLFNDAEDEFMKSGYVLNPLSSTSEKYYFDENVGYKENLSSMIEFVDTDNNTVSVLKDSFIHYLDESLSFLKNGAILDLDSINGNKAVSFYNITNQSMLEREDNRYVVHAINGDIVLNNFIGRISDNKYIVVGDLSLKMAGNSATIKGNYFEVVYVEEGIVNIENNDIKYQVAAADTLIYVGNDKVIDLGDKKITVNNEDIMSITAITINGDENIDIVPKEEVEEPDDGGHSEDGNGADGSGGNGTGTGDDQNQTGTDGENGDGSGSSGDDSGNDGSNEENKDDAKVVLKEELLKERSTEIEIGFDVYATSSETYTLQVVNLATGRTIQKNLPVIDDKLIVVSKLTPDTKYLFMVVDEEGNSKQFQQVFQTTSFGIELQKEYVTSDSLAYNIIVDDNSDIKKVNVSLFKFNEEEGNLDESPIYSEIQDLSGGKLVDNSRVCSLLFDNLDSDSIYTMVLENFSFNSINFDKIYNIADTTMTLKETPKFEQMKFTKNVEENKFELYLENIVDPDGAITSYTYQIYREDDDKKDKPIKEIVTKDASPIEVLVGEEDGQLKKDTNYVYRVIIEYFDNEKYIDYITIDDDIVFKMTVEPRVKISYEDKDITHNSINATLELIDSSCLISIPGREGCESDKHSTSVVVYKKNIGGESDEKDTGLLVHSSDIAFKVEDGVIKADLHILNKLEANTTYVVKVMASLNDSDSSEPKTLKYADGYDGQILTKKLSSFDLELSDQVSNKEHVVSAKGRFLGKEGTWTMSPEDSAKAIKKVVVSLYQAHDDDVDKNVYDVGDRKQVGESVVFTSNIKELFYDNGYVIDSLDTFDLTLEDLQEANDGKLNKKYLIKVDAYYDTDTMVDLKDNIRVFDVNSQLFSGDIASSVNVNVIPNKSIGSGKLFDKYLDPTTIVGYTIGGNYDLDELIKIGKPQSIDIYVYDANNLNKRYDFYVKNENGELILTSEIENSEKKYSMLIDGENPIDNFSGIEIYMDRGTDYSVVDDVMRRGNEYVIGYEIIYVDNDGVSRPVISPPLEEDVPVDDDSEGYVKSPTGNGVYKRFKLVEKETPKLQMYVKRSTADSITYSYKMLDPDSSVYKDGENYNFYSTINSDTMVNKMDITLVENLECKQFEGELTVSGLKNGDIYNLYYKKNVSKTGDIAKDVLNVIEGFDNGNRIFDGHYDLSKNDGFKYQIISDPLKDNRVVIKLLMDDSLFDRILSYRVKFEDSNPKTDSIEYQLGDPELEKLIECPDGSGLRCLSVDYLNLISMKSSVDKINNIKVSVTAYYDNGLTGYDFIVGGENSEYDFMIFQNNNNASVGKYITYNKGITNPQEWDEKGIKGYYTYRLKNGLLYYIREMYKNDENKNNTSYSGPFNVVLNEFGYFLKNTSTYLNPKMVSVDEIKTDGSNVFSFSSITPKLEVIYTNNKDDASDEISDVLINGSVIGLKLHNLDINDIKSEDGEYYLEIETWDVEENAGILDNNGNFVHSRVRPTYRVPITGDSLKAKIDGVKENGNYYFTVYADMLKGIDKNGKPIYEKTQLYDYTDGFVTKTYSFISSSNWLRGKPTVNYTSKSTVDLYTNRSLVTTIGMSFYKYNPLNFDLMYVVCDGMDENCNSLNSYDSDTKILSNTILAKDIKSSNVLEDDITKLDLEFGRDKLYKLYIYAITDYYDIDTNKWIKRNVLLNNNTQDQDNYLRELSEPTFLVVGKNAVLNNGEYAIDFTVVVKDLDKTLVDGKYKVKLVEANNSDVVVGNMQILDDEGNYYDISNYQEFEFDANDKNSELNKNIRITGLSANTGYRFVVYGNAYLNNYDVNVPKEDRVKLVESKPHLAYTTNEYGVAFGRISLGVSSDSFRINFAGGSNLLKNVVELTYQVTNVNEGKVITGGYPLDDKNGFVPNELSDGWKLDIIDEKLRFNDGDDYIITYTLKVIDPNKEGEFIIYKPAKDFEFNYVEGNTNIE